MKRVNVSWSALGASPAPLQFKARGRGEATVAALLDFVPAELPRFAVSRGLQVDSVIRVMSADRQQPDGPPLVAAGLGEVLAWSIEVTSPDSLGKVQVTALLPGGLDVQDPRLQPLATSLCTPWYFAEYTSFQSAWWFPSCPRQTTAPAQVTLDVDAFSAGSQEFMILLVAATSGNWTLPPVQARAVEQPEVMGLGRGGHFAVCTGSACSAAELTSAVGNLVRARPPRACSKWCSGAGTCNTDTGKCICDRGFTGLACDKVLSA